MAKDLYEYVRGELQGKGMRPLWRRMAADLKEVASYSLISKIGTGEYKSSPSYRRLVAMSEWLRKARQ